MFTEASKACDALARNFQLVGYEPDEDTWRTLKMGVKRDVQARRLRPNVSVPARRQIIRYLQTMHRETGSWVLAVQSLLHAGSWTSSGGSFVLAQKLDYDFEAEIRQRIDGGQVVRFLEIGGGWAGFAGSRRTDTVDIAGLSDRFRKELGDRLFLHFTNLTQWHINLPAGVTEHPFVTGASLNILETQGCLPSSFDIIYSQAAVYFETDLGAFVAKASTLLKPGGLLLFNVPEEATGELSENASGSGLSFVKSVTMGGMNGLVVAFERPPEAIVPTIRHLPVRTPANQPAHGVKAHAERERVYG